MLQRRKRGESSSLTSSQRKARSRSESMMRSVGVICVCLYSTLSHLYALLKIYQHRQTSCSVSRRSSVMIRSCQKIISIKSIRATVIDFVIG